jgi:hypothetical protein
MPNQTSLTDPLSFARKMWGGMGMSLPGMVTPTLDVAEIEKKVADLKAVENWLKMNLSMLQMTIQGLEMQCVTLNAVRAMGQMAGGYGAAAAATEGGQSAVPLAGSRQRRAQASGDVAMDPSATDAGADAAGGSRGGDSSDPERRRAQALEPAWGRLSASRPQAEHGLTGAAGMGARRSRQPSKQQRIR